MKESPAPVRTACQFLIILLLIFRVAGADPLHAEKARSPISNADQAHFASLLKAGYQYLLRPGEAGSDLQTAAGFAQKAMDFSLEKKNKSWEADACLLSSMISAESGKPGEASVLLEKSLGIYRSIGNFLGEGNALMQKRFQYADFAHNISQRMEVVRQAAAAYGKAKAKKEEADARREIGDLLQIIGKEPFVALSELKQSLALYRAVHYNKIHGVYDLIGYIYAKMGIMDEAVRYGRLAEKVAIAQKDSSMQLCTIYNRLSYAYFISNDFKKSFEYDQLAMDVAVRHKDNFSIALIATNFANRQNLGKYPHYQAAIDYSLATIKKYPDMAPGSKIGLYAIAVKACDNLGKHALAQRYFDQMLALANENKLVSNTLMALSNAAVQHFLATRQLDQAHKYLLKHRAQSLEGNLKYQLIYNYLWSFQLDSLNGNHLSAIRNYQLHKALKDSLQSKEKEDQVAMLNVRFDTERKDNELRMRARDIGQLERRAALQNQILTETKRNRNITAAFLILSVLFLILLYNRYKTKQQINIATAENNRVLQKMVKEREWLIRELHHRVKNNLQTVMSLLESQSVFLKGDALNAMKESQHRVQAMSLIHQKLYLSDKLAVVNMPDYVTDLIEYLRESFNFDGIGLSIDVDPVDLDVSQAIPIGLILNEAITNSLKHAFPDGREGKIDVLLKRQSPGSDILLAIRDDGVGLPDRYLKGKTGSLGIILIRGLTGEFGGNLELSNHDGTRIAIRFDSMAPVMREEIAGSSPIGQ
ncbi:Two-component sensor histidine kinase, contains HisKA and HATPase domains [Dyadobacter sp. SG02]|uniref:sensor histidine kinase n=1 Tax=Dyadobacter sp. SG02 TaxID=1855291 RepID=UPI0008C733EA|nr:sensor histidine kinase [Dyadobacter sp. SG02]SEJ59848.1 Two-component sensor histidine kinase, contains HisKA and HATPase domains [Dyadobacter sp. SG02]